MEDLCLLSAIELISAYEQRALSPVEVTKATLARIVALNSELNAFCLVDEKRALAAARASEARWANREPLGRVDGVPTTVKDIVLSKGWPTMRGSRTVERDQAWDEDAPAVARLREHGAVLLGKTTTPEFGWKGVTDSPLTGITRNPWRLDRTPGGSSGGAGAAAAAGMGALHIGTDGGGSIRIPSAFTGIFGIKPSFGRVPTYPPSPFGMLSHLGPMTRSVADAALMLSVIAEPDTRDAHALPHDSRDYVAGLKDGVGGLRIAFTADLGYAEVEPEIGRLAREAAETFNDLGATVEEADPGFENPQDVFRTLWYSGAAHILRRIDEIQREDMDPGLIEIAKQGAEITLAQYLDAVLARDQLTAHMCAFHETCDLLLMPTMPLSAYPLGSDTPIGPNGVRWDDWSPFTYPFNLTGQPAATVPCGFTAEGLPAGLQIVGRKFDDSSVLRAAQAFTEARPEHMRIPPLTLTADSGGK